jgi:hypothetical protein
MSVSKATARPERAQLDSQAVLRELHKALAVAKCIRLAAEYGEYGEDNQIDFADAVAGLLILIENTTELLDQPEVSP